LRKKAPIYMQVAIYARVSTTDQNCELQLSELRDYCTRRGWDIAGEYVDSGWSGIKSQRPELLKLMRDAAAHKFGCVLVWKLDRFSRSMVHLNEQLATLRSAGVRFIATSQNIDTDESNPTSRLLLHILAAVAEFERELIRERTLAGVQNYRRMFAAGRIGKERCSRSGKNRAHGRPKVVFDRLHVAELGAAGLSIRAIAAKLGLSKGTVERALSQKPVS
jgi:putative DNA-invertase from lambdoid prophage Rac